MIASPFASYRNCQALPSTKGVLKCSSLEGSGAEPTSSDTSYWFEAFCVLSLPPN